MTGLPVPIGLEEATRRGLISLTLPFQLPEEAPLLEHVLNGLARSHIEAALVNSSRGGVEVWRSRCGFMRAKGLS